MNNSTKHLYMMIGMMVGAILSTAGFADDAIKTDLMASAMRRAVAVLYPTTGNQAHGIVKFIQGEHGIMVVADVEGILPGKHGLHIHEYGDCRAPDGASAGGHFNPEGTPHGAPTTPAEQRHAGDFGNLVADEMGKAHLEWTDPVITFEGNRSIIGHAVVLHSGEDDLTSQPSGNAGTRVACGVIGIAKE